jgi:hypothetical protein
VPLFSPSLFTWRCVWLPASRLLPTWILLKQYFKLGEGEFLLPPVIRPALPWSTVSSPLPVPPIRRISFTIPLPTMLLGILQQLAYFLLRTATTLFSTAVQIWTCSSSSFWAPRCGTYPWFLPPSSPEDMPSFKLLSMRLPVPCLPRLLLPLDLSLTVTARPTLGGQPLLGPPLDCAPSQELRVTQTQTGSTTPPSCRGIFSQATVPVLCVLKFMGGPTMVMAPPLPILLGTSLIMQGQVFWGIGGILVSPQSESMGDVSLWFKGTGGIRVRLRLP